MDPIIVRGLAEALAPTVAILGLSVIPISIVFMSKYFKLRTRELELDAESHTRELEGRLRALEARRGATESIISTLASGVASQNRAQLEEPALPATGGARMRGALAEAPPDGAVQSRPPAVARIAEK